MLDRRTLAAKDLIAPRYADLVYEGRCGDDGSEAYDAFVTSPSERVSGPSRFGSQGSAQSLAARASVALYDERFVTFGEDDSISRGCRPAHSALRSFRASAGAPRSGACSAEGFEVRPVELRSRRRSRSPRFLNVDIPLTSSGRRFSVPTAAALEAVNRSICTAYRLWPFDFSLSQGGRRVVGGGCSHSR